MEDLIAIQGKSVAELREIAKVLGITDEKLSKKELIARIAAIGASEEAAEPQQEEAVVVEVAAPTPQKRKRARLGSVKVEAAKPTVAVIEKPIITETVAEEPVKAETVKVEATPEENKSDEHKNEEVAPQPKKRGRKAKSTVAEAPAQSEDTEEIKAEPQQEVLHSHHE